MAQTRSQQREVSVDEFMEAMCLEKYAPKIKRQRSSVSDLRNFGKKDLQRLGMTENEANRFSNCYKEWLAIRSKPPDGEWRSLMDPSGNVDGLYQNASALLKVGAVPNRGRLCNPRQQRSQTMNAVSRPPHNNARVGEPNGASNAAAVYSKVLQSVQQYLTPEAENAPWFVQSVEHADATRVLSSEGPGFFVVRLSAKSPGNFVLAYNVERQNKPSNAYIFGSPQGLFVKNIPHQKFRTLMDFVRHFIAAGATDTLPGLSCPLRVIADASSAGAATSVLTLGGSGAADSSTDAAPARSRKLSFEGFGDSGPNTEEFSTDGGLSDAVATTSERARREEVCHCRMRIHTSLREPRRVVHSCCLARLSRRCGCMWVTYSRTAATNTELKPAELGRCATHFAWVVNSPSRNITCHLRNIRARCSRCHAENTGQF
eukprot:m.1449309 g.1449309  ORF g.1449309 m.1449309 type:complete len:430 (+) comp25114_c0_seq3:251-1540(+)